MKHLALAKALSSLHMTSSLTGLIQPLELASVLCTISSIFICIDFPTRRYAFKEWELHSALSSLALDTQWAFNSLVFSGTTASETNRC